MTQNRKPKSPNTFQGCESDTSLKNKFEIEMHMETNDQSGIPPVTLQRIGYRPLHLYLIFLLVCVHDHSPYHQSDVTILKQWYFSLNTGCDRPCPSKSDNYHSPKTHKCLSLSLDYWLSHAADEALSLYEKICSSLLRVLRFLDQQVIVPSMTFYKDLIWILENFAFIPWTFEMPSNSNCS